MGPQRHCKHVQGKSVNHQILVQCPRLSVFNATEWLSVFIEGVGHTF